MNRRPDDWISPDFKKGWVSVIVPTYNRAELLGEAVQSIYAQSYRPIECVIVDDGSTDGTADAVQALETELQQPLFTIIHLSQSNLGAPAARNRGTCLASGEFFQYLDSDDLIYRDKIKSQVDYLEMNPDCDAVFGDWDHGNLANKVLVQGELRSDLLAQFYGQRVIHTLSFMFRRRIVAKIGPWDTELKRNQEMDFHLRGVLAGGKYDYQPLVTGLWRVHDGARIVSVGDAVDVLKFYEKWITWFETQGLFTPTLRKVSADNLFWNATRLGTDQHANKLAYLRKVLELDPCFPELSTPKMRFLRCTLGRKLSIRLWNWWSQNTVSRKNQHTVTNVK